MQVTAVTRNGQFVEVTTADGVLNRTIGLVDLVSSVVPYTAFKVLQAYVSTGGQLMITYIDANGDEATLTILDSTFEAIFVKHTDVDDVPVDGVTTDPVSSNWAYDHNARDATASAQGHATAAQITKLDGIAAGADVTGSNPPQAHKASHQDTGADEISVTGLSGLLVDDQHILDAEVLAIAAAVAHKDTHDPNDGADPLDTANASEITGVQAAGTGASHSLARADHAHQIQAAITDDHLLTVDDASAADDDFARFTAAGIEGIPVATAISALLAAALPEDTVIRLDDVISADEHFSGIVEIGTMGYSATVGELMYLAVADSKWELAKADVAATSFGKLGICLATTAENSTCNVLLYGKVRSAKFPTLTVGAPVFISAATGGLVTMTAPTGTTNFVVRIVGYGTTAEDLFFCPDNTYLELA